MSPFLLFLFMTALQPPNEKVNGVSFQLWQQGVSPWSYTDHYISNQTGIVLSLYGRDDRLGNFAPNFRGLHASELPFQPNQFKAWEIEYFCEPDWVIGSYGDEPARAAYLGMLRWQRRLFFDRAQNRMLLAFTYTKAAGLFNEGLTPAMIRDNDVFDCHLTVMFSWRPENHHVLVEVIVDNVTDQTRDVMLILQDSAFMWFPNNDQRDVAGFLLKDGAPTQDDHELSTGVPRYTVGSYAKTHGVLSAFRAVDVRRSAAVKLRTAAGVAPYYLLMPKSLPVGYQVFPKDKGFDLEALLKTVHSSSSDLINRYLLFRADGVPAGEKVTFLFDMIMTPSKPGTTPQKALKHGVLRRRK